LQLARHKSDIVLGGFGDVDIATPSEELHPASYDKSGGDDVIYDQAINHNENS